MDKYNKATTPNVQYNNKHTKINRIAKIGYSNFYLREINL
jgi:hypothetical protein